VGDLEQFRTFIRDNDLDYPIYLATPPAVSAFGVESFPTTWFLDPEGRIVDVDVGYAFEFRLRSRLEAARD
jgi:hypothetical protein